MFRENGAVLFSQEFSLNDGYFFPFFWGTNYYGIIQNKLFLYVTTPDGFNYRIYNLPGFNLEKEIADPGLYEIEPGLFRWGSSRYADTETSIDLWNPSGWSTWQSIAKPAGTWWSIDDISRFVFDNDNELELLQTESTDGQLYSTPIIRQAENQSILFQESTLPQAAASRIPGAANKLICSNQLASDRIYKIYSLPSSTPLPVIDAPGHFVEVNISPNPTFGAVLLGFEQMPVAPVAVEVFNAQGIRTGLVESAPVEKIELPAAGFPAPGLYIIMIRSGDWKGVAKVLRQ